MKIKEKILNLLNIIKKSIEKFPVTIISIILMSCVYAIIVGNENIDWLLIGKISTFVAILASTTFLIETLAKEKNFKLVIYYILAIIWGALLTICVYTKYDVLGITNELFKHFIIRILICYELSVLILSVYFNYKKSGKTFEEYITHVAVSLFKLGIIYAILSIGILIVTSIFIFLILSGKGYLLLGRIEILLLGVYYIPTIIYTIYKQDNEVGKFAKNVIKYVLGTLVMIAFAIIYMYLLKIILLRDIPSNQIFRILATLFCMGLPIWTSCASFDEGNTFDKIVKKLPLLFIPFIFLQMYAIGVRIGENGLTEARYLCVILIIFEIIYTIIYIKNKTKIGASLLVVVTLVVISTITPFVNMYKLSAISQYGMLKKYYGKENLTSEEQDKLNGAYRYLKKSAVGEKYIKDYSIEDEDIFEYESDYYNSKVISADCNMEYIVVEGYKKIYSISTHEYGISDNKNNTISEVFKNITFKTDKGKDIVSVNLINEVKNYIQQEKSLDRNFEKKNEIIIDSNKKIVLESVYINYVEKAQEVNDYRFNGYLLEK